MKNILLKLTLLLTLSFTMTIGAQTPSYFIGLPNFFSNDWLSISGGSFLRWRDISPTVIETYTYGSYISELYIDAPNHYDADGNAVSHKITFSHKTLSGQYNRHFSFYTFYRDLNGVGWGSIPTYTSYDANWTTYYDTVYKCNNTKYIRLVWRGDNCREQLGPVWWEPIIPNPFVIKSKTTSMGVLWKVSWSPIVYPNKRCYYSTSSNGPWILYKNNINYVENGFNYITMLSNKELYFMLQ